MILRKVDVYPKTYSNDHGFTLICNYYEIGSVIETAIKNGYKDIKISELTPEEKYIYQKELKVDDEI